MADCPTYTDRQSAHADLLPGQKIVYVPIDCETIAWRDREQARFDDGTYSLTPWADDDRYPMHFCHLAIDAEGMIAYTADDEAGYLNRKTRTKPGRYLDRFYAHVQRDQRLIWASACIAPTFALATTADDCETVYFHAIDCPSCMDSRHTRSMPIHPGRVYGSSDLAVAYVGPLDGATARSVVWPAQKIHTVVYGQAADVLRHALEAKGYTRGTSSGFNGAKIAAIGHPYGGYVMPYIDGASTARDNGDGTLTLGRGDIDVRVTDGQSDNAEECQNCNARCHGSYCDDCENARFSCDRCDAECFDDDSAPFCQSCYDDASYCDHCDSYTWDGTSTAVLFRHGYSRQLEICDDCRRSADFRFTCAHCGDRCNETDYHVRAQETRRQNGLALVLCDSCDHDGIIVCPDCETTRDAADALCPDCAVSPRCAITADLLAVLEMS
jgi:hypothetical protein